MTYNLTAKDSSFRNSEILRFCNDSFNTASPRNSVGYLKTMVRTQKETNHTERIECPFYGDYIFSYKGETKRSALWYHIMITFSELLIIEQNISTIP